MSAELGQRARGLGHLWLPTRTRVQVANGQIERCTAEVATTITIDSHTQEFPIVILNSLTVPCIMGMDVIRAFKFQVDFGRLMWRVGLDLDDPEAGWTTHQLNHFEVPDFLEVWTDGCCLNNGSPHARAGIGVYFGKDHPSNVSRPLIGRQTNNRAEIEAVIEAALRARELQAPLLRIFTDSKFVADFFREWFPIWQDNGWKNANRKPIAHREDWERLRQVLEEFAHVEIQHVKGHADNAGNIEADRLAREGAALHIIDEVTERAFLIEETLEQCPGLAPLTAEQRKKLDELLKTEINPLPSKLPTVSIIEHHIDVRDHPPIKQRFRKVEPPLYRSICNEVDTMMASTVIEKSESEWSSPIVMVKKSNGKYRFCIDFREVNRVSKKDAYPLPLMDTILEQLRLARYISTIDLSQAYFQVPLSRKSREITAFRVPGKGLFHFRVMPYGLTGAPATFQRLIDKILGDDLKGKAFAYLDDIIIIGETFEEHFEILQLILRRLKEAGLAINTEKSHFCRREVQYLGFRVSEAGVQTDAEKVQPVLDYPAPTNVRQVKRFMGMVSWYRKYVPNLATLLEPISRLVKKNQKWTWGAEQSEAFRRIRQALTETPVLACPDFREPFILQTNASPVGLGAVLTQVLGGKPRVIAYASRTLSDPERKFSETERECLAATWAVNKFRPYLEHDRFTLSTDATSLRWLLNLKGSTGRLARWALQLQSYDYELTRRKDISGRIPAALAGEPIETKDEIANLNVVGTENPDFTKTSDPWYLKRFSHVQRLPRHNPDWVIKDSRLYFHRPNILTDGLLDDIDAWKLVVPAEWREEVLEECHDVPQAAHLGIKKTYHRVTQQYYWPNLFRDVAHYVRSCDRCQRTKVDQSLLPGVIAGRRVMQPWTVVAADIMGALPKSRSQFEYLLVVQDLFTRWIECVPLRRATGQKIVEAFNEVVINRWGTPRYLVTDNGKEFVNTSIDKLAENTGLRHSRIPPYTPQANPVERVNRVVKAMIRAFIGNNHQDWDLHIPEFRFAHNTAMHTSLKTSPAFLNFGRNPKAVNSMRNDPEDPEVNEEEIAKWKDRMTRIGALQELITGNIDDARARQAHYYNLSRRPPSLKVGDLVLVKNHALSKKSKKFTAKLAPKRNGPFRVSKIVSRTVVEISDTTDPTQTFPMSVSEISPYMTR